MNQKEKLQRLAKLRAREEILRQGYIKTKTQAETRNLWESLKSIRQKIARLERDIAA